MTEPVWLLKPAILAAHKMMIAEFGGTEGLRDDGLLDSALARAANLNHYNECDDLHLLAAAYASGIIRNHPFLDGNKRTGFMASFMFLGRNGLHLTADEASAVTMTVALAASEIDDASYAAWLAQNTRFE